MPDTRRPRVRIALGAVLGVLLATAQATGAFAAGPYSGIRDSLCFEWGGSQMARAIMTTSGTYINDYYWYRPTISLWTNACGSAAPYGDYKISSSKQITAKFWISTKDIDSCEAGVPVSFSCTASASKTTATYTSAPSKRVSALTVSWSEVRFIDAPSGAHAYMNLTGKTTLLGDEYYSVFNATMQ
jgi:hypothetical protein